MILFDDIVDVCLMKMLMNSVMLSGNVDDIADFCWWYFGWGTRCCLIVLMLSFMCLMIGSRNVVWKFDDFVDFSLNDIVMIHVKIHDNFDDMVGFVFDDVGASRSVVW